MGPELPPRVASVAMDEDQIWFPGPPVSRAPEVDGGLLVVQVHRAGREATRPEVERQGYVDERDQEWRLVEGQEVREHAPEDANGGGEVGGEEVERRWSVEEAIEVVV